MRAVQVESMDMVRYRKKVMAEANREEISAETLKVFSRAHCPRLV